MLQSSICTKGILGLARPVLCGGRRTASSKNGRPAVSAPLREDCSRPGFVCEAQAQSPNDSSGNGFLDYALGQGTYQLLTGAYAAFSVAMIFAAPVVAEFLAKVTLLPIGDVAYRAAGSLLLIPAVLCYSMQSAVENNRLDSPTYQRMSLGLAVSFGAFLVAKIISVSRGLITGTPGIWACAVLEALPIVAFLKLYGFSTMQDIIPGFISGVTSLFQPENINSAVYSVLSVATMVYALIAIPNPGAIVSTFFTQSADNITKFLVRLVGALTFSLSISLFTLKDAADRDRLGFSTFRNLNIAVFLAAASKLGGAWYVCKDTLSALGDGTTTCILKKNGWILTLVVYGLIALASGYNAVTAEKE